MTKEVHINDIQPLLGDDSILIDVRETDELLETGFVPGAVHVSMSTLTVEDNTLTDNKDKTIYVMCRSGKRSLNVQTFLLEHDFDAVNVAGGIIEYEGDVNRLQ